VRRLLLRDDLLAKRKQNPDPIDSHLAHNTFRHKPNKLVWS
jgi:hypothetical protein